MLGKKTAMITQEIFRVLLDSMSHPGRILKLPEIKVKNGKAEYDAFFAALYTLLDHEVTFSVIGTGVHEEFIDKVYQLTKSPYVGIDQADYVVVCGGSSGNMMEHVKRGEQEFPDKGAMVFYQVDDLGGPSGSRLNLSGPGVLDRIEFTVSGADPDDLALINPINSEFPLGIDVIFVDQAMKVASITRSSRVAVL